MTKPEKALVLKFGGSGSTDADGANPDYFTPFFQETEDILTHHFAQLCLIIGGGPRIRELQKLVKTDAEKDQVGIEATQEHAAQLGSLARKSGLAVAQRVARSEEEAREIFAQNKEFAIALGGLKIGQSTDAVAAGAAELFRDLGYQAEVVILSNIWRIFTEDPKKNPEAKPIKRAFLDNLVKEGVLPNDPDQFKPGMNAPIDPVAVSKFQQQRVKYGEQPALWFGHAEDRQNLLRVIQSVEPDNGTTILGKEAITEYYDE